MQMAENSGERAGPGWLTGAFLIALIYPLLDSIGGWLLSCYGGFFVRLSRMVNYVIPWESWSFDTSLSDLQDRANSGEGAVFLMVCWIILVWWPERSRRSRIALMRLWIRRPFRRSLNAALIILISTVGCVFFFDLVAKTSLLPLHVFIARSFLDALIAEVAALVAFEEYRGRKFVRKRKAEAATRTILDRLVS
jgi:hypothetical protein